MNGIVRDGLIIPAVGVIAFFGVDMAATEEYGYQRAGCQHFILEALKRGIGVYTPPESCLMRPMPVYGLCEWQHDYVKMTQRSREINSKRSAAQQAMQQNQMIMASCDGALEDLTYMVNTWTSPFGLPAGQVVRIPRETVEKKSAKPNLSQSPHFMPSSVARDGEPIRRVDDLPTSAQALADAERLKVAKGGNGLDPTKVYEEAVAWKQAVARELDQSR